jgi:protein-S-isoprenylcysteine O-methyltransferase Ste14
LWHRNRWQSRRRAALTAFFNLKAREEERRLQRNYPEYADYQRATGRFLPRWRQ